MVQVMCLSGYPEATDFLDIHCGAFIKIWLLPRCTDVTMHIKPVPKQKLSNRFIYGRHRIQVSQKLLSDGLV